ncbi:YchE family NAAT transporter [Buchnera aphidicola (Mollitrichosiphum nigrofasciatum)]|uniref:YchE family NAAT transporter n=1 Tax=Buchnera aphidicola TaxID=9 RepID=UPI0031B87E34
MINLLTNCAIYFNFFMNLFILVNPIGIIPIFSSMTQKQSTINKSKTNFITNFTVFLILSITVFLGSKILYFLGISISSFRMAGGLLIIVIALNMLNDKLMYSVDSRKINTPEKIAIVPLAIPLIAGPGAISTTIIWNEKYSSFFNHVGCVIAISFFCFFCWLLFKISPYIYSFIGTEGMKIITKIMGILLISIGIEFIHLSIRDMILNI